MNQDKRILFLLLLLLLTCGMVAIAQEQITLTTYYPAPFGEYETIRLMPSAIGGNEGTPCTNPGLLFYNDAIDQVLYCNGNTNQWYALVGSPSAGGGLHWNRVGNTLQPLDPNSNVLVNPNRGNYWLTVKSSPSAAGEGGLQFDQGAAYNFRIHTENTGYSDAGVLKITYSGNPGYVYIPKSSFAAKGYVAAGCETENQCGSGGYGVIYKEGFAVMSKSLKVGGWEDPGQGNIKADGNVRASSFTLAGNTITAWPNKPTIRQTGLIDLTAQPFNWRDRNPDRIYFIGPGKTVLCTPTLFEADTDLDGWKYTQWGAWYNSTDGYVYALFRADEDKLHNQKIAVTCAVFD